MKESKQVTITKAEALALIALCSGRTKNDICEDFEIKEGTWGVRMNTIAKKLSGGWRDEAESKPTMTSRILEDLTHLLEAGTNPLIQPDALSSRALMRELLKIGNCRPAETQLGQALRSYGMRSAGRMMISGERHYIWTALGTGREQAVGIIRSRLLAWSGLRVNSSNSPVSPNDIEL